MQNQHRDNKEIDTFNFTITRKNTHNNIQQQQQQQQQRKQEHSTALRHSEKSIQIFPALFLQHHISLVDLFSAYQIHGNNLINLTAVRKQFSQYSEH